MRKPPLFFAQGKQYGMCGSGFHPSRMVKSEGHGKREAGSKTYKHEMKTG
jgi:hypothetical protein